MELSDEEVSKSIKGWIVNPRELDNYMDVILSFQNKSTKNFPNLSSMDVLNLFISQYLEYIVYNAAEENYIDENTLDGIIRFSSTNILSILEKRENFKSTFKNLASVISKIPKDYISEAEVAKKRDVNKIYNDLKEELFKYDQIVFVEPRKGGVSNILFLSEIVEEYGDKKNIAIFRPRHIFPRYGIIGEIDSRKNTAVVTDRFSEGTEYDAFFISDYYLKKYDVISIDWKDYKIKNENLDLSMPRTFFTYLLNKLQRNDIYFFDNEMDNISKGDRLFYYLILDFLYLNINNIKKLVEIEKNIKKEKIPNEISSLNEYFIDALDNEVLTSFISLYETDEFMINVVDSIRGAAQIAKARLNFMFDIDRNIINKKFLLNIKNRLPSLVDLDADNIILEKRKGPIGMLSLGYYISKITDKDIYLYNPRKIKFISNNIKSNKINMYYDLVFTGHGLEEASKRISSKLNKKFEYNYIVALDLSELCGDSEKRGFYTHKIFDKKIIDMLSDMNIFNKININYQKT